MQSWSDPDVFLYVKWNVSPINGQVFTLVPEKIIVFKTPSSQVPECSTWSDIDGERHFSALFYADLLAYMGVSMVVWLDKLDVREQDEAVFKEHGLAVCTLEDLGCTDPSERFSLQTISSFVEVCRHARGPVAVCGDDRLTCTLLTAYMLRSGLFADAAEAVSWICIARGAAAPQPDPALLRPLPGGHSLSRKVQSLMNLAMDSFSDPGCARKLLGEPCMGELGAGKEPSELSPCDIVLAAGRWEADGVAVGVATGLACSSLG
jgi:hypothetical protein